MRKNAKYLLITLLSFCFAVNVKAAECSYEKQVELGKLASTVTATYEAVEIDTGETYTMMDDTDEYKAGDEVKLIKPGFALKILNISDEIYVTVKNNYDGSEKDYFYKDTEKGTLQLDPLPADGLITYTITIYSSLTDCSMSALRTDYVTTPYYNRYSENTLCNDNPDYEYCQKYINNNISLTLDKFYEGLEKYQEEQEVKKEEEKGILNYIKKNKNIILVIGGVIFGLGIIATIIILIIRKKRLV